MRLWFPPEGTGPSFRVRSDRKACPLLLVGLYIFLFSLMGNATAGMAAQQTGSASPHVGSAMAVLATLEQAQVLPPEGSREADRVIQSVIQFQSAFAKSTDRALQDFVHRAVAVKHGEEAASLLERFRANGWTTEILEALADADQHASTEELDRLATGFRQFNLSVDDFKRFMQLVRDGRSALAARGQHFEEVYAHHRKTMPGAARQ